MKKIEKLEVPTKKHQTHDPVRYVQMVEKINEIIVELNMMNAHVSSYAPNIKPPKADKTKEK